MRIYKDFTGDKVGMLTIDSFANKRSKSGSIWNATCDCGNKIEVDSRHIRRAKQKGYNISCGKCEGATRISQTHPEVAAFTHLYNMYKSNANRANRSFELDWDSFNFITSQNCVYCGTKPIQKCYNTNRSAFYLYNGIDRVDSSKGYVFSNCVTSCGTCNVMKRDMNVDDFYKHLHKILSHSPSFDAKEEYKDI